MNTKDFGNLSWLALVAERTGKLRGKEKLRAIPSFPGQGCH